MKLTPAKQVFYDWLEKLPARFQALQSAIIINSEKKESLYEKYEFCLRSLDRDHMAVINRAQKSDAGSFSSGRLLVFSRLRPGF